MAKVIQKLLDFLCYDEENVELEQTEYAEDFSESSHEPAIQKRPKRVSNIQGGNVVSLPGIGGNKMIVYRPVSYEDTQNIIDNLKSRKPVIVNMEQIEVETAQRILDFMSGACYAVDGKVYKVSSRIFLVAPANYDVIGNSDGFRE